MRASILFVLGLMAILIGSVARAATETTPPLEVPSLTIDPGNESNVEEEMYEADIPQKMALLPIDRGVRNEAIELKQKLKDAVGLDFALESTTIYQATSGVRRANMAMENTSERLPRGCGRRGRRRVPTTRQQDWIRGWKHGTIFGDRHFPR